MHLFLFIGKLNVFVVHVYYIVSSKHYFISMTDLILFTKTTVKIRNALVHTLRRFIDMPGTVHL